MLSPKLVYHPKKIKNVQQFVITPSLHVAGSRLIDTPETLMRTVNRKLSCGIN